MTIDSTVHTHTETEYQIERFTNGRWLPIDYGSYFTQNMAKLAADEMPDETRIAKRITTITTQVIE